MDSFERSVHQQDHIKTKDQIAIKNEYVGLPQRFKLKGSSVVIH